MDSGLEQPAAIFGSHDKASFYHSAFNQLRNLNRTIHDSEASVGYIVDPRVFRKTCQMMNTAGGGRFEVLAAYAGMDQALNIRRRNVSRVEGSTATLRAFIAYASIGVPQPAFADTAHPFKPPLRQFQALVDRIQLRFDILGADHQRG